MAFALYKFGVLNLVLEFFNLDRYIYIYIWLLSWSLKCKFLSIKNMNYNGNLITDQLFSSLQPGNFIIHSFSFTLGSLDSFLSLMLVAKMR